MSRYFSRYGNEYQDDFSSQNGMGAEDFLRTPPSVELPEPGQIVSPQEAELQPTGYWMRQVSMVPLGTIVELDPYKSEEQQPFRERPGLQGQGDYNIDSV